ncbi:hypothetical protein D6D03_02495 [Aureobasidium pullulans]|nr:hypothetical protein D6D03_02495 [Aureobasidium pullulans]
MLFRTFYVYLLSCFSINGSDVATLLPISVRLSWIAPFLSANFVRSFFFPFLSKLLSLRLSRPRAMRMFHPSKCTIMLSSSTSATVSDYLIPLSLDLALFSKIIVRFYSSFDLPPNRFAGSLEGVEARYLSESDEGSLVSCPSLSSGLTESSGYDCLLCFH